MILVEKELLGGVCLNWGCIPSKAMIEVAGLKHHLSKVAEIGLSVHEISVDLPQMHQWKDLLVLKLRGSIENLLKKNDVTVVQGVARFHAPGKLAVSTKEGLQHFEFKNAIIATGSSPIEIPGFPMDGELVIDSTGALSLATVPKHLLVVGAGSVGLELATVYRNLGAEVTIVELQEKLLPTIEPELSRVLEKSLKKIGINLVLGASVETMTRNGQLAEVVYSRQNQQKKLMADKILVAVGRRPNSSDLGFDRLGLTTDSKGFITVNERLETEVKGIYAIGDIVAGPMLAHRASHMGKIAAEVIAGKPAAFDNFAIPGIIFSDPEIATVGLTEAEAQLRDYEVKTGAFPFRALGRALTLGETEGLTKIVSDAASGTVLGVHIIGPHASDLIGEGTLAVESAAHIDDLPLTIHAHPTLAEGIMEASEALENKAIHIFTPSK